MIPIPFLHPLRRLAACLAVALAATACGGSDDDDRGTAQLRVLNAAADVGAVDVTIDNDDIDETARDIGVAADTATDYAAITASQTQTLRLRRAGGSSTVATYAFSASRDSTSTLVAYGREGALKLTILSDDEDAPSSGRAKVRVFNAAVDAGTVDVYLTDADALLDEVSPTIAGVAGGAKSTYGDIGRGSYRLRVTGKDDKADLRLDVPAVAIDNQQRVTIVLQPTPGGVLVHALVVPYRGAPEARKTTAARARLVAGVGGNGSVSASIGGTSLNVGLRSPSIGAYTQVPSGSQALTIQVNGSTTLGATSALTAGADYTVLVFGEAGAPEYRLLADDNRLPATSTRAKLRLVHGATAAGSGLTLAKDYVSVADNVAPGSASTPVQVDSATDALLQVTSPLSATPLYQNEDAVLVAGGVYTTFMLGGAAQPTGVLRRDR